MRLRPQGFGNVPHREHRSTVPDVGCSIHVVLLTIDGIGAAPNAEHIIDKGRRDKPICEGNESFRVV